MLLTKNSIAGISLDAAGLIALADLQTIARRTALTGSASYFDIFFLAPGIHVEQEADEINKGEQPATGAMTSGYVFRIENQATAHYLQGVGKPGQLVTVKVERQSTLSFWDIFTASNFLYIIGISMTVCTVVIVAVIQDFWAVGLLFMLMFARLLNVVVIKHRTQVGWKGVPEPGVQGDLLVLLTNDRWVRMRGLVDDLKVVASGQWLRDQTEGENYASALAKLLVFVAAALASNASTVGKLLIALHLLVSVALLGVCNTLTSELHMFGRRVYVEGQPKKYTRRLDMAKELIEETGREDWAVSLGLVLSSEGTRQVVL